MSPVAVHAAGNQSSGKDLNASTLVLQGQQRCLPCQTATIVKPNKSLLNASFRRENVIFVRKGHISKLCHFRSKYLFTDYRQSDSCVYLHSCISPIMTWMLSQRLSRLFLCLMPSKSKWLARLQRDGIIHPIPMLGCPNSTCNQTRWLHQNMW